MKFTKVIKASESKDSAKKSVETLKLTCDRLLKTIDTMSDENQDKLQGIIEVVNNAYSELIQDIIIHNIELIK